MPMSNSIRKMSALSWTLWAGIPPSVLYADELNQMGRDRLHGIRCLTTLSIIGCWKLLSMFLVRWSLPQDVSPFTGVVLSKISCHNMHRLLLRLWSSWERIWVRKSIRLNSFKGPVKIYIYTFWIWASKSSKYWPNQIYLLWSCEDFCFDSKQKKYQLAVTFTRVIHNRWRSLALYTYGWAWMASGLLCFCYRLHTLSWWIQWAIQATKALGTIQAGEPGTISPKARHDPTKQWWYQFDFCCLPSSHDVCNGHRVTILS